MSEAVEIHRLTTEFRSIYKAIDDLNRRAAATVLSGSVAEIRGDEIRLELLPQDGRTGKRFLSPWVKVQEMAGKTGSRFPVKVGDPMRLLSPNGEIGPASLAIRGAWTDDAPAPNDDNGELVLAHGGCAIRMKGGKLTFSADHVAAEGAALTHNDVNVGSTHRHGGVFPGAGQTDVPVA